MTTAITSHCLYPCCLGLGLPIFLFEMHKNMKLLSIFWTPLISEASSRLFSKLHCEVIVCPFDKGIESFIYALQVEFHMHWIRHPLNFQDESHVYQLLNTAHFKLNIFGISRDQPKRNWLYVVYLIIWLSKLQKGSCPRAILTAHTCILSLRALP